MIPSAPEQARWLRTEPRGSLPWPLLERIVQATFPRCCVLASEALVAGSRNANFKLYLDPPEPVVLRIYEHDASLCQKEVDLMWLVGGLVPVPEMIRAEPHGWEDLPPFILTRWVEGITFSDLKRRGDANAIGEAAQTVGETLATIGRFRFPKPGWIGPGPKVVAPLLDGADPMPRFVDQCLASEHLQRRVPAELRNRTQALVWSFAPQLASLDRESCLVHGDFSKRNLLVRQGSGRWHVAAVLDWEFAVSGSPLADLGSFLRYERASRPLAEPHFSAGYVRAGGRFAGGLAPSRATGRSSGTLREPDARSASGRRHLGTRRTRARYNRRSWGSSLSCGGLPARLCSGGVRRRRRPRARPRACPITGQCSLIFRLSRVSGLPTRQLTVFAPSAGACG